MTGAPEAPSRAPLALIGPGAAGSALAAALSRCGWPLAGVLARSAEASARAAERLGLPDLGSTEGPAPGFDSAPLVLFAVRDREIRSLAESLAERSWAGRVALHLSGALSAEELEALRERGAAVASFHPLMTFPPGEQVAALPADTPFFCEGDELALQACSALAEALGVPHRRLPAEAKVLYHCAATIAGNATTVLLGLAEDVLAAAGVEGGAAWEAPLARESVLAAARQGPAAALTGPVARGEAEVLARHVAALRAAGLDRSTRELHLQLSAAAAELAERAGRGSPELDRLRELVRRARAELDGEA